MKTNTYITEWSDSAGNEFTQYIYSNGTAIPVTDSDFTDAYYLGYISADDVPTTLQITDSFLADGEWVFKNRNVLENVDIGFMGRTTTRNMGINADRAGSFYKYNETQWATWSSLPSYDRTMSNQGRLPNNININLFAVKNIVLYIAVSIATSADGDAIAGGFCTISMSLEDFISGTTSITLSTDNTTFSGRSFAQYSATITLDDLDGTVKTVENDGNFVTYALCHYCPAEFFRDIKTDGSDADFCHVTPFFRMHADFDGEVVPYVITANSPAGGVPVDTFTGGGLQFFFNSGLELSGYPYDVTSGRYLIPGGFSGTVAQSVVTAKCSGKFNIFAPPDSNFFFHGTARTDFLMIRRSYSYSEVRKHFSLLPRWTTDANTYDNAVTKYYPLVDGLRFMCDFANGARDRDRLTEWELLDGRLNPATSEYDPADKPPYTPPGPEDDEKIGDSISFNLNIPGGTASGLYTMYALRQAHVNNLGAALWTSFNSPDSNFWQNVRMAAGLYEEAGSFDLSTILDFIASIRIYPFALINLPGYAGAGSGAIRMGTGKIPLDLSTGGAGNVGIMGSYTGIIDAGAVTIPAHYGDFRDLEGVTMSVYLPYIGNVTLNPAEVTGQTLQATYAVDLTSGACVAYLLLSGSWGYYPIGVYSGTIGADIPLTASQGNRMFLRDMKNVLGLGSILGGSLSGVDATDGDALAGAIGSGIASGAAYMAKNVYRQGMGGALTPPTLGGGGANFAGFGAPQTAYVQIRRHLYAYNSQTFPADQMGRRSYGVKVLGTLSGFTVCDAVDVSGIPAPADIQTDIKNALESGVYL